MIWTVYKRCHWQSHDFKGLVLEAKSTKSGAAWRVTKDGKELTRGKNPHVIEAMRAAKTYAESLIAKEKSKSDIIKEYCVERGIPYVDVPLSKEESAQDFPEPTTNTTN